MVHIINPNDNNDRSIKFNPEASYQLKCPHCGSKNFLQTVGFLLNPAPANSKGEDLVLGRDGLTCVSCRHSYHSPLELKKGDRLQ